MIIFGVGLVLAGGAVTLFALDKPLTAEEALLLANVEAIAQNEGDKTGYALVVDMSSNCTYTDRDGNPVSGRRADCEPNAGDLVSCAAGCLVYADLH